MTKIKNVVLGVTLCAAITVPIVNYRSEIGAAFLDIYKQISNIGSPPAPSDNRRVVSAERKTQVDFILQQQAQKVGQASIENQLSDTERLEKLNDALQQLESAEDEYDRELAVMDLGDLKGDQAKQGLITALTDDSNLVVSQAIRQINNWQDPAVRTDLLLTALRSQDLQIVEQTLLTINAVDDKRLIAGLKQLSKHSNGDIRNAAKLALNLAQ